MKEQIFFGTYTRKTSQGIYSAYLDTEQSKISDPQLAVKIGGPTYVRLTQNDDLIAITSAGG
ncbi:beta-propeller fold lactonase family protein, partial [Ligilactobacillus pobuzihii]